VDGGWRLARTTLANERVSLSSDSAFGGGLEAALSWLADHPETAHPVVLDQLGSLVAEAQSWPCWAFGSPFAPSPAWSPVRVERGQAAGRPVRPADTGVWTGPPRPGRGDDGGRRRAVGPRCPPLEVPDHCRRDERGAAERDRRAPARPAPGPGARPVMRNGCPGQLWTTNGGICDGPFLNRSPLAAASSSMVHMASLCTSPMGWNPPMAQILPPNTTKNWPLTSAASSEARKPTSRATLRGSQWSNVPACAARGAEDVLGHPRPGRGRWR